MKRRLAANAAADAAAKPADARDRADTAAVDAAGGSATLDRAYMVGRWTDDGDCTAVTEFRADGSFLYPWGDTGQWTLSGDQLTLGRQSESVHGPGDRPQHAGADRRRRLAASGDALHLMRGSTGPTAIDLGD